MRRFKYKGKVFELDADGFLVDSAKWDRDLAEGLAGECEISTGLTEGH